MRRIETFCGYDHVHMEGLTGCLVDGTSQITGDGHNELYHLKDRRSGNGMDQTVRDEHQVSGIFKSGRGYYESSTDGPNTYTGDGNVQLHNSYYVIDFFNDLDIPEILEDYVHEDNIQIIVDYMQGSDSEKDAILGLLELETEDGY